MLTCWWTTHSLFFCINHSCILFKIKMTDGLAHLICCVILWTAEIVCHLSEAHEKSKTEQEASDRGRSKKSLSRFAAKSQYPRAVLIASSTISFGNDCERLVNIAFGTSQSFPTMMGTCADVSQYLRKELAKQYPDDYFHIIIGENHAFGVSVDDGQYFAEIEQDRYRVLIFSTKQNASTKSNTHDANSHMLFVWN
jgi:hypothetical protein